MSDTKSSLGRSVKNELVKGAATGAQLLGVAAAAVLVIGIVFVVFEVNRDNSIAEAVLDLADSLTGPFRDMFLKTDQKLETVLNSGIAAAVYLLLGTVAARLLRRFGG